MLPVLIVLSLLSLLVATDAEPTGTPVPPRTDPPLHPARKAPRAQMPDQDQIAA
jgi:hypothetical protein